MCAVRRWILVMMDAAVPSANLWLMNGGARCLPCALRRLCASAAVKSLPQDALVFGRHARDDGADGRPRVAALEHEQQCSAVELCGHAALSASPGAVATW